MLNIFETYKKVARAFGPSGREHDVSAVIETLAKPYADEIYRDTMGNLIARKKGNGKKIMLSAHMDSIGVVATFVDEKGFIRFSNVGGLFKGDLINIQVVFQNGTRGVISYEEKTPFKELGLQHLFIDIGAKNKADAEKMVKVGDFAVFCAEPFQQGDIICGPYLDNRIGCVTLLCAMEQLSETDNDLYFVFSVQEEVGLRGAQTAAFAIAPDFGIAVDVTDTGDLPEKKHKMAVDMGKGPAVKVMDSSVICSEQVKAALYQAAEALSIDVQHEIMEFGGTDTGVIQKSRGGVPSGAVSIPTRYIHSPSEMASVSDIEKSAKILAHAICNSLR